MTETITHEVVADATARFLAAGGEVTLLPDTVAEQRAWLRLVMALEELAEGDAQP